MSCGQQWIGATKSLLKNRLIRGASSLHDMGPHEAERQVPRVFQLVVQETLFAMGIPEFY